MQNSGSIIGCDDGAAYAMNGWAGHNKRLAGGEYHRWRAWRRISRRRSDEKKAPLLRSSRTGVVIAVCENLGDAMRLTR